jgi:hypothetical protein
MMFGTMLKRFEDVATATEALVATADLVLLAEIGESAEAYGETPGEYAAGAVRRFVRSAKDEDWLALMNAMERGDDPGRACLTTMVRWSIRLDREEEAGCSGGGCTCGGAHDADHGRTSGHG